MFKRIGVLFLGTLVTVSTFATAAFADELTVSEAANIDDAEHMEAANECTGSIENVAEEPAAAWSGVYESSDYENQIETMLEENPTEVENESDYEKLYEEVSGATAEGIGTQTTTDFYQETPSVTETNEAAFPTDDEDTDMVQLQSVSGEWEYENIAGGVKITSYYGNAANVTVPAKINGYNVVAVGDNLFKSHTELKNVVLPNSITALSREMFSFCSGLTSVTFGRRTRTIGRDAFWGCSSLSNITLPDSLTYIGSGAFYGTAIKQITLPAKLETCDTYYDYGRKGPFYGCDDLTTVTFASGIKYIPANVLRGAYAVQNVVIPNGVLSIGESAFSLTSIVNPKLPNSIKTIGNYAFDGCNSLNAITFPSSLTHIGAGAFYGTAIKQITLPAKLETCDTYYDYGRKGPFYGCDDLTTVTFASGIKYIPANVLRGAYAVRSVVIPDGVLSIGESAFSLTSIVNPKLPKSVKTIGNYAFDGCNSLNAITLPSSLTHIGAGAFYGTAIKQIILPAKLETCDTYYDYGTKGPFYGCDDLTTVTFACGIKYIPANVLRGAYAVESITLPSTLTVINDYAFDGCENLTAVTFEGTKAAWNTIQNHHYVGAAKVTFLNKKSVSGLKISRTSAVYNGKSITVTVKDGSTTLKNGTHYTISYKNNKEVGTATVTIKGKGKYIGTVKKTFKILPKATTVSKVTAAKTAITVKWKKQAAQTSGYQIQYSTDKNFKSGNKKLTVNNVKTTSQKISKLKSGKTYYVRVRTLKKVNDKTYYSTWSSAKKVKVK